MFVASAWHSERVRSACLRPRCHTSRLPVPAWRAALQSGVMIPTEPIGSISRTPSLLEAARYIPVSQLGMTDGCGFSPLCDGSTTARDQAFARMAARALGVA